MTAAEKRMFFVIVVLMGALGAFGMGAPTLWHCLVFGVCLWIVDTVTKWVMDNINDARRPYNLDA